MGAFFGQLTCIVYDINNISLKRYKREKIQRYKKEKIQKDININIPAYIFFLLCISNSSFLMCMFTYSVMPNPLWPP